MLPLSSPLEVRLPGTQHTNPIHRPTKSVTLDVCPPQHYLQMKAWFQNRLVGMKS